MTWKTTFMFIELVILCYTFESVWKSLSMSFSWILESFRTMKNNLNMIIVTIDVPITLHDITKPMFTTSRDKCILLYSIL